MHATLPLLEQSDFPAIQRDQLQTLQINLGYRCNQQCLHCHVNASPRRTEQMSLTTIDQILQFVTIHQVKTLDLTGGAPEMNPHFKYLIRKAKALGVHIIDRCNLTILFEPDQQELAEFLAQHQVEVVASLPCYLKENVDKQRGKDVFEKSIKGLQKLNQLGYGKADSKHQLNLVYNPQEPVLPPSQVQLEADYKQYLLKHYGIVFNQLYTLANMPIQRFGSYLISKNKFHDYLQLLHDAHQTENLQSVMCRSLLSLDWQGYAYDCDFNQMLQLPLQIDEQPHTHNLHITDLMQVDLTTNPIVVKAHCYGCTAGQGSSCGGAL